MDTVDTFRNVNARFATPNPKGITIARETGASDNLSPDDFEGCKFID